MSFELDRARPASLEELVGAGGKISGRFISHGCHTDGHGCAPVVHFPVAWRQRVGFKSGARDERAFRDGLILIRVHPCGIRG